MLIKISFIICNFLPIFQTLFAVVVISGLSIYASSDSTADVLSIDTPRICFVYLVAVGLTFVACFAKILYEDRKANWWSLSILIEYLKESRLLKVKFLIFGGLLLGLQLNAWNQCGLYAATCNTDKFPTTNDPISRTAILSMSEALYNVSCNAYLEEDYSPAANQVLYDLESKPQQNVFDFDSYLALQVECFNAQKHCKFLCGDRASISNLIFAISLCVLGLFGIATYDGPYYEGIPNDLEVFKKLTIPRSSKFPMIWSSSSELLSSLPTMVILHNSAGGSAELFEKIQNVRSDLPWDWVKDFENRDYADLELFFLPENQVELFPCFDIEGPKEVLIDLLIKLVKKKDHPVPNKAKYRRLAPAIFVLKPMKARKRIVAPESTMKFTIVCMSFNFVIQFTPEQFDLLIHDVGPVPASIKIKPTQLDAENTRSLQETRIKGGFMKEKELMALKEDKNQPAQAC